MHKILENTLEDNEVWNRAISSLRSTSSGRERISCVFCLSKDISTLKDILHQHSSKPEYCPITVACQPCIDDKAQEALGEAYIVCPDLCCAQKIKIPAIGFPSARVSAAVHTTLIEMIEQRSEFSLISKTHTQSLH